MNIFISGASGGIGSAVALEFLAAGYGVCALYNNSADAMQQLQAAAAKAGAPFIALKADVRNADEIKRAFAKGEAALGAIHALCNCAGVAKQALFQDVDEQAWRHMFEVNVNGTINCIQAALPTMLAQKKGVIINFSSIWGVAGAACETHYSATKGAVIALTKALAKELAPSGITVNCIAPGAVDTPMLREIGEQNIAALTQEIPLGRLAAPAEIAKTALFLVQHGSYYTGQILSPNGGLVI